MRMPRDLGAQELTELLHKTMPLPTLASGTTSWNLTKIRRRNVRTADTILKPSSSLTLRPPWLVIANRVKQSRFMGVSSRAKRSNPPCFI